MIDFGDWNIQHRYEEKNSIKKDMDVRDKLMSMRGR